MLDVHPPHHPAHSWRDFFIHIATIVVGLLIAIGLEQTVEAVHRHSERLELEERLHREAEENSKALDASRRNWQDRAAYLEASMQQIQSASSTGDTVSVTLPNLPEGDSQPSQRAVWTVAKANGSLALLPKSEQDVFATVDWIAEQEDIGFQRYAQALQDGEATEKAAGIALRPGQTIHFPATERANLIHELAQRQVATTRETMLLTMSETYNMAIQEHPNSVEDLKSFAIKHFESLSEH